MTDETDKIDFEELAYVYTHLVNMDATQQEEMLTKLLKNVYEAGKRNSGL